VKLYVFSVSKLEDGECWTSFTGNFVGGERARKSQNAQ